MHAILHRQLHHIREVILALGVVVIQPTEPVFELPRRRCQDAAVNFLNAALRFASVLMFDDGADLGAVSHNASVASGIGQINGQQSKMPTGT